MFILSLLSPIWLLLMPLSFCFSSPPFQSDSSVTAERRRRRAEVLPSTSWAPVQALGGAGCELHTSKRWQPDCSYGSVRHCLQTVRGSFTAPALQKLPRELCAQNLIQHAKSVRRSPDCLPNTLNLFSDITLSGDVSFFKSVSTHMHVYPHSGSHVK